MSPTYLSGLVIVVAQLLKWAGYDIDITALNVTFTTLATVIAAVVVLYRRYLKGDVTVLGKRK